MGRKLDLLLHSQTPDTLSTYATQIAELREQEAENREQLLERVAYTWFNRLCALRYLDARGWHPFGCKVLMPGAEGETQPELLKLMRAGSLPAELKPHTSGERLHGLLDGQIPPAIAGADPQGEVYRELVLTSCRSYHQLLPELFEGLDDASELLLPDDLLSESSIAGGFRSSISDEDCEDVEIIGWLYQFYISEKKDQVIGKVVKSEDIPAATQLFTPNWIVKYMVQNSLGAIWLATYPGSPLKGQMEFYIEPAEQTPEVQAQLAAITPESLDPEALTLIDPACGSGHILVEAYDLLKAIYLERGYRQRDIPKLILTKNLYGLDICPRAAQLAALSLLMKGREDDRRLLERGIQLNVMALQDSTELNVERLASSMDLAAAGVSRADVQMLVELFTHATSFGSLIQVPQDLAEKLPSLVWLSEKISQDLFAASELEHLRVLAKQAATLMSSYDIVVANPPYMGAGVMNKSLTCYAKESYPSARQDLFSCFIDRGFILAKTDGHVSMVTMQNWMFLSSFEEFRRQVISKKAITTLVHIGYNSFPSMNSKVAQAAAFSILNRHIPNAKGKFVNLNSAPQSANKQELFLSRYRSDDYEVALEDIAEIPGSPMAYWASAQFRHAFRAGKRLADIAVALRGVETGDNEKFLRYWHEVNSNSLGIGLPTLRSESKWFPYNKGGGYRKWFGNRWLVINWGNNGYAIKNQPYPKGFRLPWRAANEDHYFRTGITWGGLTSASVTFRLCDYGAVFDSNKGSMMFPSESEIPLILSFLNSRVVTEALEILNPSLSTQKEDIGNLPYIEPSLDTRKELTSIAKSCIAISKADESHGEQSWDFRANPLLIAPLSQKEHLEGSYAKWSDNSAKNIANMKRLEEDLNRIYIVLYGLADEFKHDVPIEEVTLTINPAYRYGGNLSEAEQRERFRRDTMAELLSYATGCMMGRYSLDHPGLILADSHNSQDEHLAAYVEKVVKSIAEVQFKPDPDGILPVLDGEWFEDDIVARTREFLAVTLPESSVGENLCSIEESLGKDIRKYFCSEFYKDHLQTYKKRPIYWMVQSPKKGFACLIYLHRYTKDTLNQVLNNYFRPYLQKLEARLAQLGLDQLNDALPTRERTAARREAEKITKVLKECQAWEQDALQPLAQQRIELDLDDGVKVNYLKLQDVLAPIPGLAAKEE